MKKIVSITALTVALLSATNAVAGWNNDYEYVETKRLTIDASALEHFEIDAGAGSLIVIGDQVDDINVSAEIYQVDAGEEYCLSLDYANSDKQRAQLAANNCRSDTRIDVTVTLPAQLVTEIKDGSGRMVIDNASVSKIEDGSGSIKTTNNHTALAIEDGSGSIDIELIDGDVRIDDGSGSIHVSDVTGQVTVRDGSGSINVSNATSFNLLSDGSGSVNLSNVNAKRM
ncbi:hypothetical protein [Thalassotalea montiporae]